MPLLKINGVTVKTPSEMSISDSDLFEGERNARGDLVGDVIATKTKIEPVWKHLTASELTQIMSLISSFFFNVTYIDPATNTEKTKMFYRSDRTYPLLMVRNGAIEYRDVKVNFVQR